MAAVAVGPTQQGSGKLEDFKLSGEAPYYAEEREGWKGYIEWEACQSIISTHQLDNFLTHRPEIPREEEAS